MGPSSLIVLTIAAIVFAGGGIAVAKFFVKGTKNPAKGQAYECWHSFRRLSMESIQYWILIICITLLIFDVELVFYIHGQ